eukprot:CAMPEP_0203757126 /NCGR_PEP_ID=MMETSP0098-20131031/10270_1 /ASSEMBLY_ACC=CAM_ASM_000208 /TAXON_ID=96639 /ORGANISM=" , Strain NY0313808BC1" /LENGTH=383 /DNA_ID=CAMNT_0050649253 /DNA_START=123 /DNA_END=1271 /DNA_ORIENTATION=+
MGIGSFVKRSVVKFRVGIFIWVYLLLLEKLGSTVRFAVNFDPVAAGVIDKANQRTAWAANYLAQKTEQISNINNRLGEVDFCVVIPSATRQQSYVNETVASVVRGILSSSNKAALFLYDASYYKVNNRPEMESLRKLGVHVVNSLKEPCKSCQYDNSFVKETADYIASLEICLNNTNSRFIIVLEDDSFVSDRFVDVLSVAAEDLRENPSWLYMKLFRTSAFDGFSFTFRHIFELVVYGFVISLSACWLFSTKVRVYVTLVRVIVIWVLASSSLYILGRQNTILALTRRAGIHEISGDPSIVGVLYPVSIIPKYIEYMKGPLSRFETDLVLTDFQEKYDLKGYVLRPNLVEHVGAKTSLAAKAKLRSTISLSNLYKRCLVSEW